MCLRLAASLLLLSAVPALPQSTGGLASISGVVRDPAGATVPNAQVVIASDSRGAFRTLATNNDGIFTAPSLTPASGYSVTVTAPGFGRFVTKDLELRVGQQLSLSISMA